MSIDTDYATLRRVLHENRRPLERTWAAEFGVYSGYSLDIIADYMPVIGFDSFEGLPEDWRPGFPKGMFALPGVHKFHPDLPYCPNALLVKGWFEDTVPTFPFPALGLVHIDCDLYSSTATVLEAVTPHVSEGTLLVFDEYHSYPGAEFHEAKAFEEWCTKYGIGWDEIAIGVGEHAQERAFVITEML